MFSKQMCNDSSVSIRQREAINCTEIPSGYIETAPLWSTTQSPHKHFMSPIWLILTTAESLQVKERRLFPLGHDVIRAFRLFLCSVNTFACLCSPDGVDHQLSTQVWIGENGLDIDTLTSGHDLPLNRGKTWNAVDSMSEVLFRLYQATSGSYRYTGTCIVLAGFLCSRRTRSIAFATSGLRNFSRHWVHTPIGTFSKMNS
jgi:hypothetical protein